MAKPLTVVWAGQESTFDLRKVDREKLYGKKEKIIVDEAGRTCEAAYLTGDGSALVLSGGSSFVYVDAQFDTVERSQLQAVDREGHKVEEITSTLGVQQALVGPVDPKRVLDHIVTSLYALDPLTLADELKKLLDSGNIFETRFAYRDGYYAAPLFLLKGDAAYFALVCEAIDFPFLSREIQPEPELEEDGETLGDELDFSMM